MAEGVRVSLAETQGVRHAIVDGDVRFDLEFVAACGKLLTQIDYIVPDALVGDLNTLCPGCAANIEATVEYNRG